MELSNFIKVAQNLRDQYLKMLESKPSKSEIVSQILEKVSTRQPLASELVQAYNSLISKEKTVSDDQSLVNFLKDKYK